MPSTVDAIAIQRCRASFKLAAVISTSRRLLCLPESTHARPAVATKE